MVKNNEASMIATFGVGFIAGLLAFDFFRKNASPEVKQSIRDAAETIQSTTRKGKNLLKTDAKKSKPNSSRDSPADSSDNLSQPMP